MKKYCLGYYLFYYLKSTKKKEDWKNFEYEILFQKYENIDNRGRESPVNNIKDGAKHSVDDDLTIYEDFDAEKIKFRYACDNILHMFHLDDFQILFHDFIMERFTYEEIKIILTLYSKYTSDPLWKKYLNIILPIDEHCKSIKEADDLFNAKIKNRYDYLYKQGKSIPTFLKEIFQYIDSCSLSGNDSNDSTIDEYDELDHLDVEDIGEKIYEEIQYVTVLLLKLLKNHMDIPNRKIDIMEQIKKATGIDPNRQKMSDLWQV